MNWNMVGNNVRKAMDGLSSKIFGIMKPSKSPYSKILRKTELVGNVYVHAQDEKILREIEIRKSRAIGVLRSFQNR